MRLYIGFDDTDTADGDFGTGKVARHFETGLPEGCRSWGVVRQQLLLDRRIPYTSHNSSACIVVDFVDPSLQSELLARAVAHIEQQAAEGSDPGLCFVCEGDRALLPLMAFGRRCTEQIVTQSEALKASCGVHLSGHGGTNDGIIGAAAGVGLTASGWCGRFIEYGRLRDYPEEVSVSTLERQGIRVLSLDRDARMPAAEDRVYTKGWLRPRLLGHEAILPVLPGESHAWEIIGSRHR